MPSRTGHLPTHEGLDDSLLPRVPIGAWVDGAFDWIDDNLSIVLQLFRDVMTAVVEGLIDVLMWPPALLMVALVVTCSS